MDPWARRKPFGVGHVPWFGFADMCAIYLFKNLIKLFISSILLSTQTTTMLNDNFNEHLNYFIYCCELCPQIHMSGKPICRSQAIMYTFYFKVFITYLCI